MANTNTVNTIGGADYNIIQISTQDGNVVNVTKSPSNNIIEITSLGAPGPIGPKGDPGSGFPFIPDNNNNGIAQITGSLQVSGGVIFRGKGNSNIYTDTYNTGYYVTTTRPVTGSGLIISSSNLLPNHFNFLKIGDTELINYKSGAVQDFIVHVPQGFQVSTGEDIGGLGTLFQHNKNEFEVDILDPGGSGFYNEELLITSGRVKVTNRLLVPSITSSIISTSNGIIGSLFGTSSWATNALTASFAPNYLLVSQTSSFVTNDQTSSFVLNNQTSSMLAPYVLNSQTSSFVLNNQTSSMLAPYVLNSQTSSFVLNNQTSSMLAPYVLNSQTSSFVRATGSAIISGSLTLTGSLNTNGDIFLKNLPNTSQDYVVLYNNSTGQLTYTASTAFGGSGGGGGSTNPGGVDKNIQFNDGGFFSGSNNLIFDKNSNTISLTGSLIISGGDLTYNNSKIITENLTSSFVQNSQTSSFVQNSQTSSFVQNSQTSSFVQNFQTSSFVQNSQTSSFVQNSQTSSFVQNSQTSSFVQNSQTSSFVQNSQTSSFVQNSQTSSFVQNSQTSSFVQNSQTSSFVQNSQTSSFVQNSQTSSFVQNSQTSSFVQNSQTSSFVQNSQTSSFVQNSQTSSFVQNSQTSSFVQNSQTSSFVQNSQTSSFVQNSQTSSLASLGVIGNTILSNNLILTGSFNQTGSSEVYLKGLIGQTTSTTHVVTFNNTTGQLFITGANTFGGGGGGGGTPGGVSTTIQYNNAGTFGGSNNFTFNGTNTVSLTGSLIVSGGDLTYNNSKVITENLTGSMLLPYLLVSQTSSFVQNSQTSSFVQNSQTSSFVQNSQTSSFVQNFQTSSFVQNSQTSSFVQNSQTSSFVQNSQTSSFVQNSQTSSFVQNSQTSSMLAPYVLNSQTSSFVLNSQTGSMTVYKANRVNVTIIDSTTAGSYRLNFSSGDQIYSHNNNLSYVPTLDLLNYIGTFRTSGSQIITGSLGVSGSMTLSGGNLIGTSSWAVSSSRAISSSRADLANTVSISAVATNAFSYNLALVDSNNIRRSSYNNLSFSPGLNIASESLLRLTGSFIVSSGSITAPIISASSFTGSLFGTASWALNVVGGGGGGGFTPSLTTDLVAQNITASANISASGILSIGGIPNVSASIASLNAGVGTLQTVTTNGSSTNVPITASIISASNGFTGSLFGTSSWTVSSSNATRAISSSFAITASHALNSVGGFTPSLTTDLPARNITASIISASNGFTGSLFGTSSWATNARTASFLPNTLYNITASRASTSSLVDVLNQALVLSGSLNQINGPVTLKGLIDQTTPALHVVTFDNSTGQLFITGASTFGGGGGGSGTPGGAFNTIQYNSAGAFNGSNNFTFNGTNTVSLTGSLNISGSITTTDTISADDFVLTGTGVPTITSDTNLNLSASNAVVIQSPVLRLRPTTTASVAAIVQNGDIIYDSEQNKFFGRANGVWVAFH